MPGEGSVDICGGPEEGPKTLHVWMKLPEGWWGFSCQVLQGAVRGGCYARQVEVVLEGKRCFSCSNLNRA